MTTANPAATAASPATTADVSCDTAPAQPQGLRGLRWKARRTISAGLLPLMQRAGRAYVGGEGVDDALSVAARLESEGTPSTVGLWDLADDTLAQVTGEYQLAVERVAASGLNSYLSIKPPALRFQAELAAQLASAAQTHQVALHCDSHGPEVAEASCAMIETMLRNQSADLLSTTLPGRWQRSLTDADWVVERGLAARVVKGQWPDPADPQRDLREGFLQVVDRLAGRGRLVRVASHDVPLAAEAIRRLRAAGTPCELEVLFGMPIAASLAWARQHEVTARIYVPYGRGYIPHAIDQLRRNPRFLWWIAKGLFSRS